MSDLNEKKEKPSELRSFAIKAFIAFVVIVAGLLVLGFLHQILRVLVLTFTAALFAVLLTALTNLAMRLTRLPRAASMVVVILSLVAIFTVTTLFIGRSIRKEIKDLREDLPRAIEEMKKGLANGAAPSPASGPASETASGTAPSTAPAADNWFVEQLSSMQAHFQDFVTFDVISKPVALGIAGSTIGVIGSLLVVFVVGIYLASSPETYVNGVASLFPIKSRDRVKEVMKAVGTTLTWWLFGQFLAMLGVFILTYTGLLIIGIKAALALALLAGLFNLIPNFGPILAALPAIVLAVAPHDGNPNFDLRRVAYVAILYVVVQAIDGNVTSPIIQKRAVSLPPALTMLGQIAAFLLLGPVGLLLATPILAATLVLVRKAYIEDVLGDRPALMKSPAK